MSDLNYNINANVTGRKEVEGLKDDIVELDEATEGIATSGAAGAIDDVGRAAGDAAEPAGRATSAFKDMFAAISLAEVASFAFDFVLGKIRDKAAQIAGQNAFDAAQVQQFADALRLAGDEATNLVDQLETGGRVVGSVWNEEVDITGDLAAADITADEFFRTLREDGREGFDALIEGADEAGLSEGALNRIRVVGLETLDNMAEGTDRAAESNEVLAESQESANAALQGLLDRDDPMRRFQEEWALLRESMADGSIDTTAAAGALNTLADGLNLTTDEVLALAQADLTETAAGAQAFADALNSIDFQAAELQGATTAFDAYTTGLFAAQNQVQATEAAFDALAASAENQALTFDVSTDAGRAQQDALEGVARALDTELAQAYDAADGNQAVFMENATRLGDETLARLGADLNLTAEQLDWVATTLGLTEGDYQARFEMAGVAEAQLQLSLLQGAIEGLPKDIEQQVTLDILEGDFVGARDTIAQFYAENPVPLTTEADTSGAEGDIASVTDADHPTTIEADADTVQAASDLLDTALEPRTATIVAHAHTAGAEIDLAALANAPRTAYIDVATGNISLPSSFSLAARIGAIYVPIIGRWSSRIEGSRPGP